jgi:chromate reductase
MAAGMGADVHLLGLSGSLRKESYNTAVLNSMGARMAEVTTLRVHSLNAVPLYNQDLEGEHLPVSVRALKAAVASSDGIVLCSPEYNYGMSGVLKNAIDWISRPAMRSVLGGKPVLLMSCSPSLTGGVRAHAQMRETLSACLARVLSRPQLIITCAKQKIVDGRLVDADAVRAIDEAIQDLVTEIHMMRRAHIAAR